MASLSKRSLLNELKVLVWAFLLPVFLCSCSGEGGKEETAKGDVSDTVLISDPSEIRIGVKKVDPQDPNVKGTEYLEHYANGVVKIKGNVLGGYREGQWFSFYPSGQPWSQSLYSKGMLNGPTVTFYENGKRRYLGEYTDGMRTGTWTFWDENGNVEQVIDYSKKDK